MCDNCYVHEYACPDCGSILDEEFKYLRPYCAWRKELAELEKTSTADSFVWFLRYRGKIVKVGFGDLHKLYGETKPNAHYCKFDSVFIYWCKDEDERNIFATKSMGCIEGVVNRKAVPNNKYVGIMGLRFRRVVGDYMRKAVLDNPDLIIGEAKYWNIEKLREDGYVS